MCGGNTRGVQGSQQAIAKGCSIAAFGERNASIVRVPFGRARDAKTRQPTQCVLHDEAVAAARGRPRGQFLELSKTDRGLHLSHSQIGSVMLYHPLEAARDRGRIGRERFVMIFPVLRV
jgi:hypothetical protein